MLGIVNASESYPYPLVKYDRHRKYEDLFLIIQIFLCNFAIAAVEGFDFLAGGCYHQDKKKERLECAASACYSPSSR